VAAGVIEFSWRQQRQATFTPAYAPMLGLLMARYADSAKPFLDDLLGSTATGRHALDLSQPEAKAVCRILLDMPDIGTWRQSGLQILPHYRRHAEDLLDRDLHGGDLEKTYRATRWLVDLKAVDPAFGSPRSTAATAPRLGPAATAPRLDPAPPTAANIPDGPMVCVAPPPGLVGWWPGDSNGNDIVGGNNPSAVNAVDFVPGEVRNGFRFGSQGGIQIPDSSNLKNQQFTWIAWARPDGPGPNNDENGSVIVTQNDGRIALANLQWRATDNRILLWQYRVRAHRIRPHIRARHFLSRGGNIRRKHLPVVRERSDRGIFRKNKNGSLWVSSVDIWLYQNRVLRRLQNMERRNR
jgi:hypothetical protein